MMTRKECEDKILDLLEHAFRLFQSFNPDGSHLDMFCIGGDCFVNGAHRDGNGNLVRDLDAFRLGV